MPRFLSDEWVTAFNTALSEVAVPEPGPDASLSTRSGRYTMAEEIHGTPDATVRLLLEVDGGSARLIREAGSGPDSDTAMTPAVTIALDYDDAAALSSGSLSAADALSAGKIRVRGDLSVLVAAEQVLVAARAATAQLAASTTY